MKSLPFLSQDSNEPRIIICCGSGGVGKTTISAALALRAALAGHKTLVLTIDPAKRLADALGLDRLGYDEQRVPPEKFGEQGLEPASELYAMMLDTKRAFDQLIARYTSSDDLRENILNNWYYQHISTALAGTHEYMAMEKLYEIHQENRYELIVLDTPPSRRALDFLEAPERLINLLSDHPLLKLMKPSVTAGRWGFRLFTALTSPVLRMASHILGTQMLEDIADFFRLADEALFEGFRQRAAAVKRLLRSPQTLFLLIACPMRAPLRDALFLFRQLQEHAMPFGGFIINRVHPNYLSARGDRTRFKQFAAASQFAAQPLMEKLITNFRNFHKLAESDEQAIADLIQRVGPQAEIRQIPHFNRDVYDIAGLLQLGAFLQSA